MTPEEILKKHNFQGYLDNVILAMKEYGIHCRIQERKTHIYVLEQDLMDNSQDEGEGLYTKEYCQFMADEISNHRAYIKDLETELEGLK